MKIITYLSENSAFLTKCSSKGWDFLLNLENIWHWDFVTITLIHDWLILHQITLYSTFHVFISQWMLHHFWKGTLFKHVHWKHMYWNKQQIPYQALWFDMPDTHLPYGFQYMAAVNMPPSVMCEANYTICAYARTKNALGTNVSAKFIQIRVSLAIHTGNCFLELSLCCKLCRY